MRKMIIADDEQSSLDLLDKILNWESLGIELTAMVKNGHEALERIQNEEPDILLTDIRMPEMDGMELLDRLYGETRKTETIIISAYSDFEYAQKALSFGIAGYLLKPVNEDKLQAVIMKALAALEEKEKHQSAYRLSLMIAENRILKDLLSPSEEAAGLIETLEELGFTLPKENYFLTAIDPDYESYGALESCASGPAGGIPPRVAQVCRASGIERPMVFENTSEEWIFLVRANGNRKAERIRRELAENRELAPFIRLSSMYGNLEDLHKAYAEVLITGSGDEEESIRKSPLVTKAVAYMETNYMKDVNLDEICSNSSVSKTYFCGLFKREMGMGIWDYLTECRVRRAEELIRENILRNYEIAFEIGYENPGYFSKMFKRVTGVTPSQYRKNLKQGS